MKLKLVLSFLLLLCVCLNFTHAQTVMTGTVSDAETNETIIGASVFIKDKAVGATTDINGNFSLTTNLEPPITLVFSFLGYKRQEMEITQDSVTLSISLETQPVFGEEVVIAASRVEEQILEAPVTIHKMNLIEVRHSPAADFYTSIANLQGLQLNITGLNRMSFNTRGFGTGVNSRFLQFVDGVETNVPGNSDSDGNLLGPSEIDVRSVEVIPGAGSALYGPNVFNGALVMTTKSPFDYPGLSVYAKQGVTNQKAAGTNPFVDMGVRWAKMIGDNLAVKVNLNYLGGTDWAANDETHSLIQGNYHLKDELLALPRNHPNFDAQNVYGDEVQVPIQVNDTTTIMVNRTGVHEMDFAEYALNNFKLGASLHYRLGNNKELIYETRFTRFNGINRNGTASGVIGNKRHFHKLAFVGKYLKGRAYFTQQITGESYAILNTGISIQESLKPSSLWAVDYTRAFRGAITGVEAGNHDEARQFADRDMALSGSPEFEATRQRIIENGGNLEPSRIANNSNIMHVEANYDFKEQISILDLQVGGNFRKYTLVSNGQVYNDGPNGFGGPIPVWEYGAYAQASKKLLNDMLKIGGSIRFDNHKNFNSQITPRLSMVLKLGDKDLHAFRISAQTGFRNPTPLDSYINVEQGQALVLGGTEDNLANAFFAANDTSTITGVQIFEQLYTLESIGAFLANGGTNPALLEIADLSYLKQEKIATLEVGYKGLINNKLYVDVHTYFNRYSNFIRTFVGYSLLVNRPVTFFQNIPEYITSWGLGANMGYNFDGGYKLGGSYSYATYNADEAIANNPGFTAAFNTPQNRFSLNFSNRDFFQGLGFSVNYRWSQAYLWESPFVYGDIDSYGVMDASLSYKVPVLHVLFKLGGSNVLNQEFRDVYGGPYVGSQYYIGITFDEFLR